MTIIRVPIPDQYHRYLGIPYDEEIVPFPNFGTVMIQHRRYMPDKTAFTWDAEYSFTFREWSSCVRTLSEDLKFAGFTRNTPLLIKPDKTPESILLFHALLDGGIPVVPVFDSVSLDSFPSSLQLKKCEKLNHTTPDIQQTFRLQRVREILHARPSVKEPLEIPYIRLDHPAVFFPFSDSWGEFCQYNLLSAAQSVGKELVLFREGDTLWTRDIHDLADWLFAALFSFYYGATTRFAGTFNPDETGKILKEKKIQTLIPDISRDEMYVGRANPEKILRDTVFLCRIVDSRTIPWNLPFPWRMYWTADHFSGNGVFLNDGKGICCKGLDFRIKELNNQDDLSGAEGQLQLTGHSFLHALWTKRSGQTETFIQNLITTPFRIRVDDPRRMHFIVLDEG
jgi:hypothetical protein